MDPSIVKFVEDEDETMHSGADVEAFPAALNKDIEGDNASTSTAAGLSQGTNHTPSQLFRQWQSSKREKEVKPQTQDANRYGPDLESHKPQPTNADKNPEDESQLQRVQQRTGNPQPPNQPAGEQVPFALLIPVIEPLLDKDRAMQLRGLYVRLRSNSINKEEFVRHVRSLVGDHMLKMAVYKLQNKLQQGQVTTKQSSLPRDNNAQKQRLLEHRSDSHGVQVGHTSSNVNASPNMNISSQSFKQQAHDLQMRQGPVQTAYSDMKRLHGGGLAHFTSNSALQQSSGHRQPPMHKVQSLMSSMVYAKQKPLDQINDQHHKSQLSVPLAPSSISPGQIESSKDETFEMLSSRSGFLTSMNKPEPMSITVQLERQNVSAGNSSLASGSNAKTPPEKPTVAQKKPLEAPVSSLSKKQKVSRAFSDQSIEQLDDVTAVSGVNLMEEQLFSGSKEDSRVSEASRKVVVQTTEAQTQAMTTAEETPIVTASTTPTTTPQASAPVSQVFSSLNRLLGGPATMTTSTTPPATTAPSTTYVPTPVNVTFAVGSGSSSEEFNQLRDEVAHLSSLSKYLIQRCDDTETELKEVLDQNKKIVSQNKQLLDMLSTQNKTDAETLARLKMSEDKILLLGSKQDKSNLQIVVLEHEVVRLDDNTKKLQGSFDTMSGQILRIEERQYDNFYEEMMWMKRKNKKKK